MIINNHKNFRDQLSIDYQYQSINWYQLSSIVIDCHRLSISSIVQVLYKITVTNTDCVPLWINRVKLLTMYMYHTLFSGYHFIVFLFHHPLTCTSQGVRMWISAHSHRGKGVNTRLSCLPCFHLPSCKSAGWICWNYRWKCSHWELELELHIVLGLPDHPHEET